MAQPLSSPRRSWAGDPPHRGAAQQRLIEAAARCVLRDGLNATSLSSVAQEAGVSRPTVYRYFEDRPALMRATMRSATETLSADLARHLQRWDDAEELAVEAMVFVLDEIPRNPLLHTMWSSTLLDAAMLADFTSDEVVDLARYPLDRLTKAAGWNDAEADEAIEWMLRILQSLLVAPEPRRSDDELRALLRRRMLPALKLP